MYNPEENWRGGETTRGQILGIDMTKRLEGMATEAVDLQFIFAAGISLPTTTDGPLGAVLCRAYNKWAAKLVKGYGGKLVPGAMIPAGCPAEMTTELRRYAKELGFKDACILFLLRSS